MHILIAGGSGLIGSALSRSLRSDGHRVVALVRREARGEDEVRWDPAAGVIDGDAVRAADVVVNLAGASIGDRRLTKAYQRVVLQSRLDSTSLIARELAAKGAGVLIQGSAMGYYGDRGTEPLTEDSGPGDTFLSHIVTQWEAAARPAADAGVRVAYSRTGLVLSDHGGFAARLLPLVRRGLLGSLGPGRALHSWITLDDAVRGLRALIDSDHHGAANLVSPHPVSDRELIAAFSRAYGKRPGLPVPAWALRLGIGPAIIDLLSSQAGVPTVLESLGFAWEHPTIDEAARHVAALDSAS
ncbi:MAG: TIGR01777 family oxidoreductase [Actinomycetes bacterium]|nr:MAG: TIGR01777 family protein [Actinomycetota bacterium]